MRSNIEINPLVILMAEDDPDDRMLAIEALEESQLVNELICVQDGVELLDFLYCRNQFADQTRPDIGLLLLDLNMPRMDGREALAHIKADPDLKTMPIIVLTTSKTEEDIMRSYQMGVDGFITKPVSFQGLVKVMKSIKSYWLEIVELPPKKHG